MALFLLISIFVVNKQIDLGDRKDHIEKRGECLKIANLINSAYISGDGTEVLVSSDYVITTFNSSIISIEDLSDEMSNENIAILVSESGPSTEAFYNDVNSILNIDWYKVCFSDFGAEGCDSEGAEWLENIENNLSDLIANLNSYTTIYMEDPHIQYSTDYIEKLENWTSKGNSLILSRNIMCREKSSGEYPLDSYQCNIDGAYNQDNWDIFDITLSQRTGAWFWPNDWNVEVVESDQAFSLFPGDKLSFKNRNFITPTWGENFKSIAVYRNESCFGMFQCLSDSSAMPSIATWDIGNGKIYYIGGFEANFINPPSNEFRDTLINLISVAYDITILPKKDTSITCTVASKTYYQQISGDFKIKNNNNVIELEYEI